MTVSDRLERPLRSLRISVTDRCNLRCSYCMPEREYVWLPRDRILSFEEIHELVRVFVGLGVDRLRLTGGEPLLRRDLPQLVQRLAATNGVRDLAMTSNGLLLPEHAEDLRKAGLHRISVSLDTLHPDRFRALTRRDDLQRVLDGIEAAHRAGFRGTKLNVVILRAFNEDELPSLIAFGQERDIEVRFIEYMDVGGATRWSMERVVPRAEILERLQAHFGPVEPVDKEDTAPADRYRLPDGTVFGLISSTTEPFCRGCDRARITADGTLYTCLYASDGLDLRGLLRSPATRRDVRDRLVRRWSSRGDRGAEERLAESARGPLSSAERLRADPRLEMHTRGG